MKFQRNGSRHPSSPTSRNPQHDFFTTTSIHPALYCSILADLITHFLPRSPPHSCDTSRWEDSRNSRASVYFFNRWNVGRMLPFIYHSSNIWIDFAPPIVGST